MGFRAFARCAAIAVISCIAVPAVAADKQSLTLTYKADDPDCPDEASFRNLVAARLGYDPFVGSSPDAVRVELVRDHGKVRGRAEIRRASAREQPPARELVGEPGKCEALGAALATTLAIALDPVRALAPPPPPPHVDPPPPHVDPLPPPHVDPLPPPVVAPPPPTPPPEARPRTVFPALQFSFMASVLEAPTVALGGSGGIWARWRALSVEAVLRVMATPVVTLDSGDRVSALTAGGELVPCANLQGFSGCGLVRVVGYLARASDLATSDLRPAAYVGLRVGYGIPLGSALTLRLTLDAALAVVRPSFLIDRAAVWTAPALDLTAGLGLLVHLK